MGLLNLCKTSHWSQWILTLIIPYQERLQRAHKQHPTQTPMPFEINSFATKPARIKCVATTTICALKKHVIASYKPTENTTLKSRRRVGAWPSKIITPLTTNVLGQNWFKSNTAYVQRNPLVYLFLNNKHMYNLPSPLVSLAKSQTKKRTRLKGWPRSGEHPVDPEMCDSSCVPLLICLGKGPKVTKLLIPSHPAAPFEKGHTGLFEEVFRSFSENAAGWEARICSFPQAQKPRWDNRTFKGGLWRDREKLRGNQLPDLVTPGSQGSVETTWSRSEWIYHLSVEERLGRLQAFTSYWLFKRNARSGISQLFPKKWPRMFQRTGICQLWGLLLADSEIACFTGGSLSSSFACTRMGLGCRTLDVVSGRSAGRAGMAAQEWTIAYVNWYMHSFTSFW